MTMLTMICSLFFVQLAIYVYAAGGATVVDNGTHLLICKQKPIDLSIVFDSSSTIRKKDFQKGIAFLQSFLNQYEIGDGRNEVRVSIITFGKGIYPEDGFNLDTYNTKEEVIEAIGNVPHRVGLYTDTGMGIEYMHNVQMASARSYAEKISIVITDGNSQEGNRTLNAAASARNDGILMFAIGVGYKLKDSELLNIAGDISRVTKVDNYGKLDDIKQMLARKTCVTTTKPTTTPEPKTTCGEENPADINFVFSPADLGLDNTAWTSSFISHVISSEDMKEGFRYGVVSGSCPDDEGFNLNRYQDTDAIKERLSKYEVSKMPLLVNRLVESGFSVDNGGRPDARDIAVLVTSAKGKGIHKEARLLMEDDIDVFIVNLTGSTIEVPGAITITGTSSRQTAADLVNRFCPQRTGGEQ